VYQPLFTAFGSKAIEHRVTTSAARVIVTDTTNRPKLDEVNTEVPIVTVHDENDTLREGDLDYHTEVARRDAGLAPVARAPQDPFLMMFTSGTTGPAKPLYVPIKAIVPFVVYMRDGIGLRPEDRYWNIADPGWAYGLYYAVVGPLAMGLATTFYNGPFTVPATVDTIKQLGITNLAGAPTAYRALMAAGPQAVAPIRGQLRVIGSAGEPLNPEVISWVAEHLDTTINDHYGQTEMGMTLCNHNGLQHEVLPGAAGFSMPGFRMVVLDGDDILLPPGQPGQLAVTLADSPLFWFTGYEGLATGALGEHYYFTGDTAELNDNGSISFVGRDDDVITSSGYRIGPFDVESALIEHDAVVEAAVVGKPDPERTEIVKAFVVLREGFTGSPELAEELRLYVKGRLSAHAYPREIEFATELPKTPSGKIQRFLLRNRDGAGH
jgi:acetyl-CoA synthetase